jgi:hypothetical protein
MTACIMIPCILSLVPMASLELVLMETRKYTAAEASLDRGAQSVAAVVEVKDGRLFCKSLGNNCSAIF